MEVSKISNDARREFPNGMLIKAYLPTMKQSESSFTKYLDVKHR